MKNLLVFFLWFAGVSSFTQIAPEVYLINFTDKENTPYSINRPEEFLSETSIIRRARYNIDITEQDLPVDPAYLEAVRDLAPIKNISKWFNSVNITTDDPEVLAAINSLPFVRNIKSLSYSRMKSKTHDKLAVKDIKTGLGEGSYPDTSFYNYGEAAWQTGMLNGHFLHNQGHQGQGLIIAVLDGGFTKVNTNPAFDSLRSNNQLLGGWDFVTDSELSFNKHSHGSQVLSIMAANLPGIFVGTAPKAKYYLLRTENAVYEYLLEEENWIRAAEFADSAGVDLINSSLSYTTFSDDHSTDHSYEDLNGDITRITQAADIAASKGILVVTSAANEGETEWKYIGAPADADSVLTVGAVDADRAYAPFSSLGPTYDGRIKPNVTAQGRGTYFVGTNGTIYSGSGTSFSSPIICGLAACLWQSNRSVNAFDLIQMIQEVSTQAEAPDFRLGYGLPDFSKGFIRILGLEMRSIEDNSLIRTFPNPFFDSFTVDYFSKNSEPFEFEIWDTNGRLIHREKHDPGYKSFQRFTIPNLNNLNPGVYFGRIISIDNVIQTRMIKLRPN